MSRFSPFAAEFEQKAPPRRLLVSWREPTVLGMLACAAAIAGAVGIGLWAALGPDGAPTSAAATALLCLAALQPMAREGLAPASILLRSALAGGLAILLARLAPLLGDWAVAPFATTALLVESLGKALDGLAMAASLGAGLAAVAALISAAMVGRWSRTGEIAG